MATQDVMNNLSFAWRSHVGDGGPAATYAVTFNSPEGQYTFVPESVLSNGISYNDNTYWFPWVQKNLETLQKSAIPVDLSSIAMPAEDVSAYAGVMDKDPSTWGEVFSGRYNTSAKGFLIPGASAMIDSQVQTAPTSQVGNITGLGRNQAGELVYRTSAGGGDMYITPDGTAYDPQPGKKSSGFFKRALQNVGEVIMDAGPILPLALNFVAPGLGTAVSVGSQVGQGNYEGALLTAGFAELGDQSMFGNTPTSAVTPEMLATANATSDPIAALNASAGWTGSDLAYLAQIGAPTELISQAAQNPYSVDSSPPFSETMEMPPPAVDLPEVPETDPTPFPREPAPSEGFKLPELTDFEKLLAVQAAAPLVQMAMTPEPPEMPQYTPKEYKPNWDMKFDAPVAMMEAPEDFGYVLDSTPSPYLTQSEVGPFQGENLFDPSQAYLSNVIQSLRMASDKPSSKAPGFTLFQSAQT